MADVIYHRDPDASGSGAALGVILGILLVLVLLFGAWWLFFRQPVVVDQPNTTIIEEQPVQPDVNVTPAPENDTNINVNPGGETSPTP